jgi:hypothetical protein
MTKPLTKPQLVIIKKFVIYFCILIVAVSIPLYLGSVLEGYEQKEKALGNEVIEMNRKLDEFNRKAQEFSSHVQKWEALSEGDKSLLGLRINDAKETLDKLEAKYKLSSVKTSFSKPAEIIGDYKTETVTLYSSIVSISFNSLSDEMVYNFIGDLTKNFPGIVQIKSLSLNKPASITKEMLRKISIGEDVVIMSGTIDFYWHDLKYNGPMTQAAPNNGGPAK